MSNINSLGELYDALERFDWWYEMSDDHRVWSSGRAERFRLREAARHIEGGEALFNEYSHSVATNTAKPPRPK